MKLLTNSDERLLDAAMATGLSESEAHQAMAKIYRVMQAQAALAQLVSDSRLLRRLERWYSAAASCYHYSCLSMMTSNRARQRELEGLSEEYGIEAGIV